MTAVTVDPADLETFKQLRITVAQDLLRRYPSLRNKGETQMSTTKLSLKDIVARERLRLTRDLIPKGLPVCYNNLDEFLADFGPDFSWNKWSKVEFAALLADPEWVELADRLLTTYGINLIDAVRKSRDFTG